MNASITPGLLDGVVTSCTYPDSETTSLEVGDCVVLVDAYQKPALVGAGGQAVGQAALAGDGGHLRAQLLEQGDGGGLDALLGKDRGHGRLGLGGRLVGFQQGQVIGRGGEDAQAARGEWISLIPDPHGKSQSWSWQSR